MEFRDLKRQYSILKKDIDAAMVEVAAGGTYIGGDPVKKLEERLAEYVGVKHCISCANGTDALTLALKAWGIGPGDAVFVPDFTFFSSAETVAGEGAEPVFVDVEASTFNMDPDDLERRIAAVKAEGRLTPKAVVTVDLFGLPADYRKLRSIADAHGLWILEDGAQGFGGSLDGRRACSFGDIATTSFFPAKPLGCYGDGGAIFTDNDDWAALMCSLKVHGKGSFKYDNVRIGMNSRLDTLQAAVLLVKFDAFAGPAAKTPNAPAAKTPNAPAATAPSQTAPIAPAATETEVEAVNRVAAQYRDALAGLPLILPQIPEGFVSSWAQYTVRCADRDALQAHLKSKGIPSMVYYPTGMHAQTAFGGLKQNGFPVSEELCRSVLSLPMHPYMTADEVAEVAAAVKSFFGRK